MAADEQTLSGGKELLEAYRQMLAWLFIVAIVVMVALAVIAIAMERIGDNNVSPTVLVVSLAGTLGALFSALSRLYSFEELPKALLHPDLQGLRNRYLAMYSLIPPLIGSVAAVVVYMAFAAGYLQGELFPKFTCKIDDCSSFGGLLSYGPEGASDYARALIWGFSSGFSERIVRDVLQKYATAKT